eukprot:4937819-Amphidinium_carterae.1
MKRLCRGALLLCFAVGATDPTHESSNALKNAIGHATFHWNRELYPNEPNHQRLRDLRPAKRTRESKELI